MLTEGVVEWVERVNGVDIVVGPRGPVTYAGAGRRAHRRPAAGQRPAVIEAERLLRHRAPRTSAAAARRADVMETALRLIAPVAQTAESSAAQREKLVALGTLSAGLAHELNNPAAAARRSASDLAEALEALQDTLHDFVSAGIEREDAERLVALQREAMARAKPGARSRRAGRRRRARTR